MRLKFHDNVSGGMSYDLLNISAEIKKISGIGQVPSLVLRGYYRQNVSWYLHKKPERSHGIVLIHSSDGYEFTDQGGLLNLTTFSLTNR